MQKELSSFWEWVSGREWEQGMWDNPRGHMWSQPVKWCQVKLKSSADRTSTFSLYELLLSAQFVQSEKVIPGMYYTVKYFRHGFHLSLFLYFCFSSNVSGSFAQIEKDYWTTELTTEFMLNSVSNSDFSFLMLNQNQHLSVSGYVGVECILPRFTY